MKITRHLPVDDIESGRKTRDAVHCRASLPAKVRDRAKPEAQEYLVSGGGAAIPGWSEDRKEVFSKGLLQPLSTGADVLPLLSGMA